MSQIKLNGPFQDLADVVKFEQEPESTWLRHGTIYNAFRESAERFGDKPALVVQPFGDPLGDGVSLSFTELLGKCNQVGNMFLKGGLQSGETVTYLLPQSAEAFYTLIGAEAVGIVNAINPMLDAEHILGIMKAANTKVLVAPGPDQSPEVWDKVAILIEQMPDLKAVFVTGSGAICDGKKLQSFSDEMSKCSAVELRNLPERGLNDIVGYYHTGGTTGVPKLVPHTNRMQLIQLASTGYILGYTEKDNIICGLPLFHISGSIVGGLVPLLAGATLHIISPLGYRDPLLVGNYWKLVEKFGITVLGTVPTVLSALLNIPVDGADISSLRIGTTGGSACPIEVLKGISEKSGVDMREGYGMTEVTSYSTFLPRDTAPRFGSIGVRQPYTQIKAVHLDENGDYLRDSSVDEIGVIVMKGSCVMQGYVQERHNAEAFVADGWLNSGDLGRIDADGYIWLTGRAKDLIIRSGHNLDPALIEEPLHEHPAVELAAAIGRPDSYAGEMPIAYVQLKPGMSVTADELKDFARERISERAANPAEIHLIETMPLTGVGKIFKPALREMAATGVFGAVLADLDADLKIEMVNDPAHGLTARVIIDGSERKEITEEITHRLGVFTLHHEVNWTG
ncbi:MAG: acyl-CoA synthetase [Pseudomonas marincola]